MTPRDCTVLGDKLVRDILTAMSIDYAKNFSHMSSFLTEADSVVNPAGSLGTPETAGKPISAAATIPIGTSVKIQEKATASGNVATHPDSGLVKSKEVTFAAYPDAATAATRAIEGARASKIMW